MIAYLSVPPLHRLLKRMHAMGMRVASSHNIVPGTPGYTSVLKVLPQPQCVYHSPLGLALYLCTQITASIDDQQQAQHMQVNSCLPAL